MDANENGKMGGKENPTEMLDFINEERDLHSKYVIQVLSEELSLKNAHRNLCKKYIDLQKECEELKTKLAAKCDDKDVTELRQAVNDAVKTVEELKQSLVVEKEKNTALIKEFDEQKLNFAVERDDLLNGRLRWRRKAQELADRFNQGSMRVERDQSNCVSSSDNHRNTTPVKRMRSLV